MIYLLLSQDRTAAKIQVEFGIYVLYNKLIPYLFRYCVKGTDVAVFPEVELSEKNNNTDADSVDPNKIGFNAEIHYLLGIDAGGTKTEFLLTDLEGNEINRVLLGASNPVNAGFDNTKKILSQGIFQTCTDINLREVSAYAGLAGGISGNNKMLINEFMQSFGFGASDNGSDTDNALEAALTGGNGIVVIMGTGIVAFSQNDGVRHRTGGWGYLIDKGGSGFAFGSDALDCALKHYDCRDGSPLILRLIEKELRSPLHECIPRIYSGGPTCVASFAHTVFEAFRMGDKQAEAIIEKNISEVAEIIRTAGSFVSGNKKVVLCGGICNYQDILQPFIQKHLNDNYTLEFMTEPMVKGAVALAKNNIKNLGE